MKFEIEFGERKPKITNNVISPNEIGVFKSTFQRVEVGFFNFGKTETGIWGSIDLFYRHHNGGTNGAEILRFNYDNGKWKFGDPS